MKIARWTLQSFGEPVGPHGPTPGIGEGFVIEDRVVPFPDGLTVAEVLAQGLDGAHALLDRVEGASGSAIADVQLLAPLVPASIRDFVTFEEHVEGVSAGVEGKSHVADEWYEAPTFYFTNPHTVLGPGEPVEPARDRAPRLRARARRGDRRRGRGPTVRT